MPARYTVAFDNIAIFVRSFLPSSKVDRIDSDKLCVQNGAHRTVLTFSSALLEDFEEVLGGSHPVPYSKGIKCDLYFRIYVTLGNDGLIPGIRISEVLINQERRDWLSKCRLEVRFDNEFTKGIVEGLSALQSSLLLTLRSEVELPEIEQELQVVKSLIDYHTKMGHLNCPDAERESLSYLKAAALCWILKLEDKKMREPSLRIKVAYDKKIYAIVRQFWVAQPYNRIELPPAIGDYVAQQEQSVRNPHLDHKPSVDIGPLLTKMDSRLADRWNGAWQALRSDNLDRVSQAANSMVEVLDQVIDRVRGPKDFRDYLKDRFPKQVDVVIAQRTWISKVKESLHAVKHDTEEQPAELAEYFMHQAEGIINLLLR